MKYSPEHMREIGKISQETLRHWRTVLPPLSTRKGRNIFSLGDALALLIIKDLCSLLKIKVSELVPFADALFDLCDPSNWNSYNDKVLVFDPASKTLGLHDELALHEVLGPAVLINLGMHIVTVKNYALGIDKEQLEMQFLHSLTRKRLQ